MEHSPAQSYSYFALQKVIKADTTKFFNSYHQQNTLFNSE